MNELLPVLEELIRQVQSGQSVALCSVVKTRGSTPQSPGASLLLRCDLSTVGTLGGGCVEEEVKRQAYQMLNSNESRVLGFTLDHDYGWDDGLICGGKMEVAVVPLSPHSDLANFQRCTEELRSRRPSQLSIRVTDGDQHLEYRLHLEVPPTVLIAGAGHVGQAVASLALMSGFHVVVIDDRPEYANHERFDPQVELKVGDIAGMLGQYPIDGACHVVIVTRGHQHDQAALDAVITRPAGYIGLIGSRRKSKLILDDLRASGVSQEHIERVHTPIGLPIGAITVPEIAVSIVAELIQVRRQNVAKLVEGPFVVNSATT